MEHQKLWIRLRRFILFFLFWIKTKPKYLQTFENYFEVINQVFEILFQTYFATLWNPLCLPFFPQFNSAG
jgi:hypothetical protein